MKYLLTSVPLSSALLCTTTAELFDWKVCTNYYGGPQLSRKNQKPHGKNKIPQGKTENLTAKTKTSRQNQKPSRQKQNTSRQNQNPHGKTKDLRAKPNTSQQKPNTSRQKQIPTQNQCYFVFAVKYLVCREVFGFAVRYFVFICRDVQDIAWKFLRRAGPFRRKRILLARLKLVSINPLMSKLLPRRLTQFYLLLRPK